MNLLNDFDKIDYEKWKLQAIKDLKNKDFDSSLKTKSKNGLSLEPYYTITDVEKLNLDSIQNAQLGVNQFQKSWFIEDKIKFGDNSAAITALKSGATSLFITEIDTIDIFSMSKTLNNIKLNESPVLFETSQPLALVATLIKTNPSVLKGGIITKKGEDFLAEDLNQAINLTLGSPLFYCLNIQIEEEFYKKTETEQVSLLIFRALDKIDKLITLGQSISTILQNIQFNVEIGSDFFLEISKIRAIKFLFAQIIYQNYKIVVSPKVRCIVSKNKDESLSDDQQLIASTFAAISATLGGCDTLAIERVYEIGTKSKDFSSRITRNISLILSEESFFDKVKDPTAGSYFVESMTQKISEEALELLRLQ